MKFKILIPIITAGVLITAFIANGSRNTTVARNTPQQEESFPKHLEGIAQKLFNNDYENKKGSGSDTLSTPFGKKAAEKSPTPKQDQEQQKKIPLEELAGPVNNEYGIRDDIYDYVKQAIPRGNEKAMKAALTYAAKLQLIYYKADNEKQAVEAIQLMYITLECMGYASNNEFNETTIARKINSLMSNTPERDKHILKTDARYFGWKVLGSGGKSTEEIKEICEKGSY